MHLTWRCPFEAIPTFFSISYLPSLLKSPSSCYSYLHLPPACLPYPLTSLSFLAVIQPHTPTSVILYFWNKAGNSASPGQGSLKPWAKANLSSFREFLSGIRDSVEPSDIWPQEETSDYWVQKPLWRSDWMWSWSGNYFPFLRCEESHRCTVLSVLSLYSYHALLSL